METADINQLRANPKNPRTISKHDFDALVEAVKEFGDLSGVVFNTASQQLVGGHQRVEAFKRQGVNTVTIQERYAQPNSKGTTAVGYFLIDDERYTYREVNWPLDTALLDEGTNEPVFKDGQPVYYSARELAANVAANRIQGEFVLDLLAEINYMLLKSGNEELLKKTGQTPEEINSLLKSVGVGDDEPEPGNLAETFIVPPFSILDTKQGYWQDRKRAWLDVGLKSEEGRDGALIFPDGASRNDPVGQKIAAAGSGTSIFDPVLCEISYRWFNVPNGKILDPFAGGSVRGVLASRLGYPYVGHELRLEQVTANRVQAEQLCAEPLPLWVQGDSNVTLDSNNDTYDMILSCPPYADLEVYSDDPADLSNMDYADFLKVYRSIIQKACAKLKDDRFAVWVIGEVRGKSGAYYNFVGDTIDAFLQAGVSYYNEIVLANVASSLALRAGRQFNISRKIGKQHQNVLVFYKGDTKNIKNHFTELDFSTLSDEEEKPELA
jgi:hypothetical protein